MPLDSVNGRPSEPTRDDTAVSEPADLVRRIRAGDRDAEEELFRRYRRGVVAILHRAGNVASAADDLSQDAFALALQKIRAGEVREPERLPGFLCALARNLSIERFRKAATRRAAGEPDEELESPASSPLEELLRAEKAAIVRKVLDELPSDRDRQILFRFYISEEDKEAIRRDLGLTSLHFNRVVFRARERYRQLYLERTEETAGGPG